MGPRTAWPCIFNGPTAPGALPVNLTVICPGLFGPIDVPSGGLAPTPALDRLLSRAEGTAAERRDPLETLAGCFGLRAPTGSELPSAPFCLLADAPHLDASGWWCHADPVHLRPDRDRLLLFAGPALGVREDEAAALAAAFNAHFAPDGLELTTPVLDRWYLRVRQRPDLRTWPLHAVAGRPVDGLLPTGPDARDWARWQTETQMLFHAHPVNAARESAGRPTLGGLWTWGGGELQRLAGAPDLVVADHPLALGLASAAGTLRLSLDAWRSPGGWAQRGKVLVFWDGAWWPALEGDGESWQDCVSAFEILAVGLLSALETGRIRSLTIDDGSGLRLQVTRGALRRFWRRRGGFPDWRDRAQESLLGDAPPTR